MKIIASDIALASSHALATQQTSKESLRAWVGAQRPDLEGRQSPVKAAQQAAQQAQAASAVQISQAGKQAQSGEAKAIEDASEAAEHDPRVQLIKNLVEFLLGKKIHLKHLTDVKPTPEQLPAPANLAPNAQSAPVATEQPAGWGIEYDYHSEYSESERTSFQASGVIRTADNQEISFNFSFEMQRSYHEESNLSIRQGDAKKVDPLVLNFSGNATQLTSQKFAFDLNADGTKENIAFVQGAGFLVLDKNSDGVINDGKELFGPASGNGFAELQALDSDGNNWIDENDAAFAQLQVWSKDGSGADQLSSLQQAGVGALFLGSAATPFSMNDTANKTQAQLVSSGLWLSETGQVNSLQQIDLFA